MLLCFLLHPRQLVEMQWRERAHSYTSNIAAIRQQQPTCTDGYYATFNFIFTMVRDRKAIELTCVTALVRR